MYFHIVTYTVHKLFMIVSGSSSQKHSIPLQISGPVLTAVVRSRADVVSGPVVLTYVLVREVALLHELCGRTHAIK
jgi:hypothetical protein